MGRREGTYRFSVDLPAPCPAFLSIRIRSGCGLSGFKCWSVAACLNECNGTTRSSSTYRARHPSALRLSTEIKQDRTYGLRW